MQDCGQRTLEKRLSPVFAKYDMEFKCEMLDTVPWNQLVFEDLCCFELFGIFDCSLFSSLAQGQKLPQDDARCGDAQECVSRPSSTEQCRCRGGSHEDSTVLHIHAARRLELLKQCGTVASWVSLFLHEFCLVRLIGVLQEGLCQATQSLALSAMPGDIPLDDRVPRRLMTAEQSKDVFALVKMQMSATSLSQKPLNVWPQAFMGVTEDFWNQINRTRHTVQQDLEADRKAELKKLAREISKDFPHLSRAVNYYDTLLDESRERQPYAKLKFVDAGPNAGQRIARVQLGGRALPPRPHPLQVVFRHNGVWWSWNLMASWGKLVSAEGENSGGFATTVITGHNCGWTVVSTQPFIILFVAVSISSFPGWTWPQPSL